MTINRDVTTWSRVKNITTITRWQTDVSTNPTRIEQLLCEPHMCGTTTATVPRLIAAPGGDAYKRKLARTTCGVVQRYPVGFSPDPILADLRVTFARRCTYSAGHGRREPTRQVMVSFAGPLPNALDLGSWGVYSVRRFTPESLRCFKCQAFGHVQKHCGARELCAVCSGRHPTSECISALI